MPLTAQTGKTTPSATSKLRSEVERLVAELCAEDWGRSPAELGSVTGPLLSLALDALARQLKAPLFLIVPNDPAVADIRGDFDAFGIRRPLIVIPEADFSINPDSSTAADWLPTLSRLAALPADGWGDDAPLIVCPGVQGMLTPLPDERRLKESATNIRVGETLPPRRLVERLERAGFEPVVQVEGTGQFSLRGGVLDLWPASEANPLRFEYFGDEIESIREFDPASQRSLAGHKIASFPLLGAGDDPRHTAEAPSAGRRRKPKTAPSEELISCLFNYLPKGSMTVTWLRQEVLQRLDGMRPFLTSHDARSRHAAVLEFMLATPRIDLSPGPGMPRRGARAFDAVAYRTSGPAGGRTVADELSALLELAPSTTVFAGSPGEAERLRKMLSAHKVTAKVEIAEHDISGSVRMPAIGAALVSGADLLGKHRLRAGVRDDETSMLRVPHRAIEDFIRLDTGDHVVHIDYGIARYLGIDELRGPDGSRAEFLKLEFAQGTVVHVPVTQADLVQRYIGAGGRKPNLSDYKSGAWAKRREATRIAVQGLAEEMLRMNALRMTEAGFACPPGDSMLHDFVESFPWRDTPDQEKGWSDIEYDMEAERPMDRLVCGDVGFGKTELAVRACMKVVLAGRQAAVLVPTTVLAHQHYLTFLKRLEGHPVSVDHLSRFKTGKAEKQLLANLESGKLDIVIGTHRLLSKDVRFRDLGLLIIDEEQRFGVVHKDRLKQMRTTVDVLTLSATPIPRTLHMSLLGLRDITSLTTPPEHRQPVETRLTRWDDRLIRDAISAELARGGQVYFVHNRVNDINQIAAQIRHLVPDARVDVGHGQMAEGELEQVMVRFINHETDVLVATTIIESGIDVPNANTIFINHAHRHGLADLHQLRGRVGRWKHQARCFLIVPEEHQIQDRGVKRLKAIVEHHALGSGFHIAMRDLELRGAGNIIGAEQSGHIATVGYDLYCQLLEEAVRRIKGERKVVPDETARVELGLDLVLPRGWISDPSHRVEAYRRIGRVRTASQAEAVAAHLKDRFGKPPKALAGLLQLALVRARLGRLGVVSCTWAETPGISSGGHFRFKCHMAAASAEQFRPANPAFRVLDQNIMTLPASRGMGTPQDRLNYLANLLQSMVHRKMLPEPSEAELLAAEQN